MMNHNLILFIYILTFLIGLPANVLSLCAFSIKIHTKVTPTDILLLNLTVSDLLFLLFLPLKMHEAASAMRWELPYFLCSLTSFFFFSTIYTSSLLLMAVSVDRYLAVAFPIRYKLLKKPIYAGVGSAAIWIFSSAHCSIVFFTEYLDAGGNSSMDTSICYENFTQSQLDILLPVRLEFFIVIFLAPLLISVFSYLSCIRILCTRSHICAKKRQKAIGMALGTLLVFVVCFLPYNLSHLVGTCKDRARWRYYTLLLSTFNTCLDPIIFYFSSSTFQATMKYTICMLLCCGHKASLANMGTNESYNR